MRTSSSLTIRSLSGLQRASILFAVSLRLVSPAAAADPKFWATWLSFPAGPTPAAVAIADVDRDGRLDVVTVCSRIASTNGIASVSIDFGNGDGTFGRRTEYAAGVRPRALAIGDFDRNGWLDIAVADHGANAVLVFLNKGGGAFGASRSFATGLGPLDLEVADVDGNGALDLLAVNHDAREADAGTLSLLRGNGDGTFVARQDFGRAFDTAATLGDVNLDGRPDLVTVNDRFYITPDGHYPVACYVRLGNGDGTFQEPKGFGRGVAPIDVRIADLNLDGQPDLAVLFHGDSYTSYGDMTVLLGQGDGTFRPWYQHYLTGHAPVALVVADLNADGRPDIATSNSAGNSLSVFTGRGDGSFKGTSGPSTGMGPSGLAVGDLDGNGTQDLVTSCWTSNTLAVSLGNGDGTFGPRSYGTGLGLTSVAIADLDKDGRLDLVTSNTGPEPDFLGTASVLRGTGTGSFGPKTDAFAGTGPQSVAVADFDGNGWPDLALACPTNSFTILLGTGNGRLGVKRELPDGGDEPVSVAAADLNLDGSADLAFASHAGNAVSVLLGNGNGWFPARRDFAVGAGPQMVVVADMNRDGRPDLLTADELSRSVSVLLGDGAGGFLPAVRTMLGNVAVGPRSLSVADIDDDGHLDVAVAGSVLLGNGDGTFKPRLEFVTGDATGSQVIADFDGDGWMDVAWIDQRSAMLSVALGNGDGTFGAKADFGVGTFTGAMASADLNGDGRPDLIVTSRGGDYFWGQVYGSAVAVILNRCTGPEPFAVGFEFTPHTFSLGSRGQQVTGSIEPTPPLAAKDIDVASIRLNGIVPVAPFSTSRLEDRDRDGLLELVVRFERAAVARTLSAGDDVPVTVTGRLRRRPFIGTDHIRVIQGPLAASGVLSVRGLTSGPASGGRLALEVTLPDAAPARLEVLDVAGRVVIAREVGALGQGQHALELPGAGDLRPGVYFLRLAQDKSHALSRVVLLR